MGALLVFDITDRDSFDQLNYWLNCLREHADENLVIALVGKHFRVSVIILIILYSK